MMYFRGTKPNAYSIGHDPLKGQRSSANLPPKVPHHKPPLLGNQEERDFSGRLFFSFGAPIPRLAREVYITPTRRFGSKLRIARIGVIEQTSGGV